MASLLTKPSNEQQSQARQTRSRWLWWLAQVGLDCGLINLAFLVAYHIRYVLSIPSDVVEESWRSINDFGLTRLLLTVCIVGALQAKGLYRLGRGALVLDELAGVAGAVTVGLMLTTVAGVALRIPADSRLVLVYSWVLTILSLALWRLAARFIRSQLWRRGIGIQKVIVVGGDRSAVRVMQALADQQHVGYHLVGFVDDAPTPELTVATQHRLIRPTRLGSYHDLSEVVRRYAINEVFIALPSASHQQIVRLMATCRQRAVRFKLVPDLVGVGGEQVQIDDLNGVPLIGLHASAISGWDAFVKRAVDVVLSATVLIVGLPAFLLIALAIRLDSPGPIFFRQRRVGRDEKQFVCYKFRSMYQDAEQRLAELQAHNEAVGPIFKIRNDPRRTRVGTFLRRTSLDELPQVINILRGEMSWVGPRPSMPSEVERYEEWHRQRLQVTPGLTGLWQVSGRSNLTFDEMVLLDLYYAEHWSLGLDLKIMLRTIPAVLLARGAY